MSGLGVGCWGNLMLCFFSCLVPVLYGYICIVMECNAMQCNVVQCNVT